MNFGPDLLLSVFMAIGTGVGVYSAIRADLATLHERSKATAASTERAHERIDEITLMGLK